MVRGDLQALDLSELRGCWVEDEIKCFERRRGGFCVRFASNSGAGGLQQAPSPRLLLP
jgi:hypothetical protein